MQGFLNAQKVPQLFIESGCNCWSNPKYPYSLGWQPPYTVDGKILGSYIKANFAGKKIGYLYQDDEFGQDVVKGLDMEIPSSSVVSRQTYDAATLAGPLSNQMAALKAAGAQVVVLATIPAATALAMLPAAVISYFPQYVVDSVGADPPTVGPLLSSFAQKGGGTPAQVAAAGGLLNGVITDRLLRARVGHDQPVGPGREEDPGEVRALALRQVRARREHPVRRGAGLHVRSGAAEGRQEPDPTGSAQRHRQRRQELRDPGLRAALLLELGALRVRGRGGREARELGAACGDADGELDRRRGGQPGEVTNPGSGPIKKYTGPTSVPPKSLSSSSG